MVIYERMCCCDTGAQFSRSHSVLVSNDVNCVIMNNIVFVCKALQSCYSERMENMVEKWVLLFDGTCCEILWSTT